MGLCYCFTALVHSNPNKKVPTDCNWATQQIIFHTTQLVNICSDTIAKIVTNKY